MNRKRFFDSIRESVSRGSMNPAQVQGCEIILDTFASVKDIRWTSYALATAYHETAATMQPIAEYGKGKAIMR